MENVKIETPVNFSPERRYIAKVILKEFLGLNYEFTHSHDLTNTYEISWKENKIVFEDHFFANHKEEKGFLDTSNIPANILFAQNQFVFDRDIPVIFGNDKMQQNGNELRFGMDIFAAAFFMLTRWEETVIKEKDYIERFPAHCALAYKQNFLHRPLVNEIVEMLKKVILHLDPSFRFPVTYQYDLIFTHDIDWLNAPVTIKEFAKDLLKRKRISAFSKRLGYLLRRENPYNIMDYLMDVSESNHTISRFYIMTGHNLPGRDGENYNVTPLYREMLARIKQRGHFIGFHPSLFTYNNEALFKKEKAILEQDTGMSMDEGRQHALRFDMPVTWQVWNDAGMRLDSTLGYSAMEGFRCGTGNTYSTFDIINRKELNLRERPLVVMDNTLHVNRKLSLEECRKSLQECVDTGKKFNMPVTLLVHNLIKDSIDWQGWMTMYDELFMNK